MSHRHKDARGLWTTTVSDPALDALTARVAALEGAAPTPAPPPTTAYDAEWRPAGGDETARLTAWLLATNGKRRAVYGDTGVTSVKVAGLSGTVDFNGAKLHALDDRPQATLWLQDAASLTLGRPTIVGRGYGTYHTNLQWQHGIGLYGGKGVVINDPVISNTYGDGIDVDVAGSEPTPLGVVINRPVISRACRNGITLNAGQTTVTGGSIDATGLHSIDLEPNGDREALSIDARISGVRLTRASNMAVFDVPGQVITGRAISGLGYSAATKQRLDIRDCSADDFQIAVDHAAVFVFSGNRSDAVVAAPAKTAFYYAMGSSTISGNANVTLTEYPFR